MTHPEDIALLRDTLLAHRRSSGRTPDCLDLHSVAAFADGTLDGATRARALPHLAACQDCRAAVAATARALADRNVAAEVRRAEAGGVGRLVRVAGSMAAAAALVLLVFTPFRGTQEPMHRAPTIVGSEIPAPLAPLGVAATVDVLRWRAVPGADRYRVTLYDASGAVLFEAEGADTAATVPDTVMLTRGGRFFWRVEARTGFDRWASSALAEFAVARESSP